MKILEITANFRVSTLVYFCHWFGEAKLNEYVMGWSNTRRPKSSEYNNMPIDWQTSFDVDKNINFSIAVIDTSEESHDITKMLADKLSKIDEISISSGGANYIEVKPDGINKGVALEFVSKELNIPRSEILAIGDNDNDLEMLSWAGIGVAVKNASKKAKQSSDYICDHDAFGGAIQVMNPVKAAKKYFC